MAPEILQGDPYDFAVDWSLGVVCLGSFNWFTPFTGTNPKKYWKNEIN